MLTHAILAGFEPEGASGKIGCAGIRAELVRIGAHYQSLRLIVANGRRRKALI